MQLKKFYGTLLLALSSLSAYAGPFAPAAGQAGSTAIAASDPSFVEWATSYKDYFPGSNVSDAFKTPTKALGKATGDMGDIVALGDSGRITLSFARPIMNGAGADFAVFENSFSDTFLELAFVEVSSNGSIFARFPAFSFTANPVNSFATIDPTNIDGLAGKYRAGYGTPFDLDVLSGVSGLDVNNIRYVRIVDIKGDGSAVDNYPAAFGGPHPIYDPDPTVLSGGFDLEAVGAIHIAAVPEPTTYAMLLGGLGLIFALSRRGNTQPKE